MKELKKIINSIFPINDRSVEEVTGRVVFNEIPKESTFIDIGKPNNHEYFLLEGICRSFILSPEGEEVTISFYAEGSVLSPYVTRTLNGVSTLNFQALTDITIGKIESSYFEGLMVNHIDVREFGNMVLKIELQKKVEKELNSASLTALERLKIFRRDYPGFENLVPHPTIASFLGITNVSLSRLRKDRSL